jgi:hypothetical protein
VKAPRFLPVVAVALVLVAPACGKDSPKGASPAAWTSSVCTNLSTWIEGIETGASGLRTSAQQDRSPAAVKEALTAFLAESVALTDRFVTRLRATREPSVDHGAEIRTALIDGVRKQRTAFASASTRASQLPIDDAPTFQNEVRSLSTDISAAATAVETNFKRISSKYPSDDLNEAFAKNRTCSRLDS